MYRISSRSVVMRALLCALALLLALAPISGAAAATPDDLPEQVKIPDASATEAVAVTDDATEAATVTAAPTGGAAPTESAEVTATQDTAQLEAAAPGGGGTANQDGPYTPDPSASPTPSGNGQGSTPHDSGSKGNADGKNPPGQMPGPDDDGDVGYECDGNQGVAKGNPAHTQCPPPNPRINIDKTGPTTSTVGATITYRMTVTNTGNRPLSNVVVSDPRCNTAPVRTGGDTNGDNVLQTTETWTYTCPRLVLSTDTSPLLNTATVTGRSPEGVTVTDNDDHSVTLSTVQPSPPVINIDKTGPANSTVGAIITYTMTVTNPVSAVPLKDVSVTDPKCNAAPVRTGGDTNGDNVLQSSETWTYTCQRTVLAADLDASGILHNLARVDARSTLTDAPVSDTDPHQVNVAPQPTYNVSITKDPDLQTVVSGGTATWTITVRNTGAAPLTGVFVSDPEAPDCNRTIGDLPVGAAGVRSWTCTRTNVTTGFTNVAFVDSNETDVRQDSAVVSLVPQNTAPSILLRKTALTPTCPKAGDKVTYRFEIINNGSQTLTDVALNDPLLGGAVTLADTNLTPGEVTNATGSYTLKQSNIKAGSLQNTATVTSQAPSGAPVTNTGNATVMLEDCPGEILLEKSGPATAQVGEQITYTFTVTNTGDVPLTNVRITDPRLGIFGLPVNPINLAPKQQGTATATYTVTEADADDAEILNVAFVRARTPDDTEIEDDDDHRTTVPLIPEAPDPAIRLVKSGPDSAGVGETVTYTFTVTNTGNTTLRNVSITDPLLGLQRLRVRPSTLAPDEQGTATATYVVTEADAEAGSIYNTAVARGVPPTGPPVTDDDDHTVEVPLVPPVCPSPPCGPPPDLPATGIGTTGFALTALLSLALGGVLLGIAGSGNLQAAMANSTVNADSPMLAMLRQWNLAPKPGGSQARRRRRR